MTKAYSAIMVSSKTESSANISVFSTSPALLTRLRPRMCSLALLGIEGKYVNIHVQYVYKSFIKFVLNDRIFLVSWTKYYLWAPNFQDFIHQDFQSQLLWEYQPVVYSVSPELLLYLQQCFSRDNKHLIHVFSQHVAGVADVHRCFWNVLHG